MNTIEDQLNSIIGPNWDNEPSFIAALVESEKAVSNKIFKYFSVSNETPSPIISKLFWDINKLHKIFVDYTQHINKLPDISIHEIRRMGQIRSILYTSLEVVRIENESLNTLLYTRIYTGFSALFLSIYKGFEDHLKKLDTKLRELQKELEKAKIRTRNAQIIATINTSITAITLMIPPLGLAATTSKFILQRLFEASMGDIPKFKDIPTSAASDFGDHITKIKQLGNRTKRVAKTLGKGATILGFYFDCELIWDSKTKVIALTRKMEETKKEYDRYVKFADNHMNVARRTKILIEDYKKGFKLYKNLSTNAEAARDLLEKEARKMGYKWL